MTPDHLGALAAAQATFAEQLDIADLDAPVAGCAPWLVTDLALHLGTMHRWAAALARGEEYDDADPSGPREPGAVRQFYGEGAELLRRVLSELGPDAPCPTLVGFGTASFWRRRQLHETVVHLWDLFDAGGRALLLDPVVTADTVEEVVAVMEPRQVRLGRMTPLNVGVELRATDIDRSWFLGDIAGPRAVVVGPSLDLALLLWRRIGPDRPGLETRGDAAALAHALAQPITP